LRTLRVRVRSQTSPHRPISRAKVAFSFSRRARQERYFSHPYDKGPGAGRRAAAVDGIGPRVHVPGARGCAWAPQGGRVWLIHVRDALPGIGPRDSRAILQDLEQWVFERGETVSSTKGPQQLQGRRSQKTVPRFEEHSRLIRAGPISRDKSESGPAGGHQELRATSRMSRDKTGWMLEREPQPISTSSGGGEPRELPELESIGWRLSKAILEPALYPKRHDYGRGGAVEEEMVDEVGRLLTMGPRRQGVAPGPRAIVFQAERPIAS